jgi:hypothetical protein
MKGDVAILVDILVIYALAVYGGQRTVAEG